MSNYEISETVRKNIGENVFDIPELNGSWVCVRRGNGKVHKLALRGGLNAVMSYGRCPVILHHADGPASIVDPNKVPESDLCRNCFSDSRRTGNVRLAPPEWGAFIDEVRPYLGMEHLVAFDVLSESAAPPPMLRYGIRREPFDGDDGDLYWRGGSWVRTLEAAKLVRPGLWKQTATGAWNANRKWVRSRDGVGHYVQNSKIIVFPVMMMILGGGFEHVPAKARR